jgi:hypothetical protein
MPTDTATTISITFDVDWAPDWCVERCVRILDRFGVKATFFATHASEFLEEIKRRKDRFEVGLHPNFHPGSSHGSAPAEVIEHCLGFAGAARSMRTHGLMQWSNLYALIANEFPQIETDVSTFLPGQRSYEASHFYLHDMRKPVTRLAFGWEDDVAAAIPGQDWTVLPAFVPGLNILNFHPIHVALNMETMERYGALRSLVGGRRLADVREAEIAALVNPGAGSATMLERLCEAAAATENSTISEVGDAFRAANPWPPADRS